MFETSTKLTISPLAVTIDDAARISARNRRRIYDAIKNGDLPALKDGRATLILMSDIEKWLGNLPRIAPRASMQPEHAA
jgi:excisionase family DNA binding protein